MSYVQVNVNSASVELPVKAFEYIPLLKREYELGHKLAFETSFDVDIMSMDSVLRIVNKGANTLVPFLHMNSHKSALSTLRLAKYFEIDAGLIGRAFGSWTSHAKWIDLFNPEYLYLLYCENENLVDFKRFFRSARDPFDSVVNAVKIPEVKMNPTLYVNLLMFFKNYKLNAVFDNNDKTVQDKLRQLYKARNAIWQTFLVDPYTIKNYFEYVPSSYEVWDHKGISVLPQYQYGENTLAVFDDAIGRMREFAHGMLEKPGEKFPSNVIVAGGSVSKFLGKNYNKNKARQSDVDLFVFAPTYEERSKCFGEIIDWFKGKNTYYALRGSVATIYVKNVDRKFQIISSNCITPNAVISGFDLTHNQWCYWDGKFYGTPEACLSMREQVSQFCNTSRLKVLRMIKALYWGYSIKKDNIAAEKGVDITELVSNPQGEQVQKIIREMHGWYYPKNTDMDPEEERMHILCQIEKDANAMIATDDPIYIKNNVTISGNFDTDYASILYTTFNPANLVIVGRDMRDVKLADKSGTIRLTTCTMTVSKYVNSEIGIDIHTKPVDASFVAFCNTLEGPVLRLFHGGEIGTPLVDKSGQISFGIPRHLLNRQAERGVSVMKNQRGMALNIEEDLKVGDEIQVMFIMQLIREENKKSMKLLPVKLIKYQRVDAEEMKKIASSENTENIETTSDFSGEIKYDD